ncbi:DUF6491 family protein [Fulvimonas sp. R45]|uniref:DUF6491 family protein n=1 Tax=Fulvimonas sp. R45 TaxID=3045937 RepID=UPI00265ED6BE|nr:DUF6491 family protein [Fulvimonas sp. R45]MDO1530032.1 DUF6491 family protein [Fulvimonas sp. R45]
MKPITLILPALALACMAGASAAMADTHAPQYQPIRPVSSCLRSDRINEWHVVDKRTVIARAGPDRYLVKLQADCPRLGMPPGGLSFRSNPANQAVMPWSICGEAGETVRSRYQPPCAIRSVQKIDKAEFDQLRKHAGRHGSGADQPTRP